MHLTLDLLLDLSCILHLTCKETLCHILVALYHILVALCHILVALYHIVPTNRHSTEFYFNLEHNVYVCSVNGHRQSSIHDRSVKVMAWRAARGRPQSQTLDLACTANTRPDQYQPRAAACLRGSPMYASFQSPMIKSVANDPRAAKFREA